MGSAALPGRGWAEAGALATGDDAVVETYPFRSDLLVLALPPGHALAGRERVPFAETLASDFIGLAGDSALHQHLVGHATRAGRRMRLRARAQGAAW